MVLQVPAAGKHRPTRQVRPPPPPRQPVRHNQKLKVTSLLAFASAATFKAEAAIRTGWLSASLRHLASQPGRQAAGKPAGKEG
jgi:hypothetical protein